jgi:hypothetical protein
MEDRSRFDSGRMRGLPLYEARIVRYDGGSRTGNPTMIGTQQCRSRR